MLKGQPKHNLTHQLTHNLGIAIVKGDYAVGEGMPSEADICDMYEVSRSATREAVKMLSAKGLISSRPKQGIRVLPESNWNMFDTDVLGWILNSKPSIKILQEFTQVRIAVEPQAAGLAAQNASPEQLSVIESALERVKDADDGLDDPLDADIAFHTSILKATGNRFFSQLTDFISTALRVSTRFTNRIRGAQPIDLSRYENIVTQVKAGKVESAQKAVKGVLTESLSIIESQLN